MNINYRQIHQNEYPFLKEMLYEALFTPPGKPKFPKSILDNPDIIKYVEHWNQQDHDLAIVAAREDELVGAIWGRTFDIHKKGYGFVDQNTPEISMAVKQAYRNTGIGTTLLHEIEREFSRIGVNQLSLSVDKLNPALQLYKRCGYQLYEEQETAITMVKTLHNDGLSTA